MTLIKKIFGILLSLSVLMTSFSYVNAEEIYNGEFIKRKYTLCKLQSVTSLETDNFLNVTDPLPGKTEISFSFALDEEFLKTKINVFAKKFDLSKSICPVFVLIEKTADAVSLSCINFDNTASEISENVGFHRGKNEKNY